MTWENECSSLKWDDPLPDSLKTLMIEFFIQLFDLEGVEFLRSLWLREDTAGSPELVVFSDGSTLAFGTAVYIRWKLVSGGWWATLVMSKGKIAPKNRITVPRLELNGAVLAKRIREFLVEQLDVEFSRVYHLVDSSTVLGYVHKEDAKLKPYEGVRVSEIQTAGVFKYGRLLDWSWIETELNPADWATKPRLASELGVGSFWQQGPEFLREEYDKWPIRHDFKTGSLEGELKLKSTYMAFMVSQDFGNTVTDLLKKTNNVGKLFRIVGG